MKTLKYISLILIIFYNHVLTANSKMPWVITTCKVINSTYVDMVPHNCITKGSTNFSSEKNKSEEYYFLVSEEGINKEGINIYYKSTTSPFKVAQFV